ncbi:unnamed protein product [Prorocentrum cordatum]|nr:unnamed protein product [Polarella glacialis]
MGQSCPCMAGALGARPPPRAEQKSTRPPATSAEAATHEPASSGSVEGPASPGAVPEETAAAPDVREGAREGLGAPAAVAPTAAPEDLEAAREGAGALAAAALAAAPPAAAPPAARSPKQKAPPPELQQLDESSSEEGDEIFPVAELGPDGLPSVGSVDHDKGECKRCCFFPKGRCTNGHDCQFCHFDHEKRKRLKKKKKRGTGSEAPTPSSAAGSLLTPAGGLLSPGMMLAGATLPHSPVMGELMPTTPLVLGPPSAAMTPMSPSAPPMTPMSPSAPPAGPPQLCGLRSTEPPPPPPEAPSVQAAVERAGGAPAPGAAPPSPAAERPAESAPEAAIDLAGQGPTAPAAAAGRAEGAGDAAAPATPAKRPPALAAGTLGSVDDEEGAGKPDVPKPILATPTGAGGKPVTLEALLGASEPKAAPASAEELPFWTPTPSSACGGSAAPLAGPWGWPASPYGTLQPGWPFPSGPCAAGVLPTTPVGAGGAPLAAAAVPVLPFGGLQPPPSGLERDSPRSVILTLSGAWGALAPKTPQAEEHAPAVVDSGAEPVAAPGPRFTRRELLDFRKVSGDRPDFKMRAQRVKRR